MQQLYQKDLKTSTVFQFLKFYSKFNSIRPVQNVQTHLKVSVLLLLFGFLV